MEHRITARQQDMDLVLHFGATPQEPESMITRKIHYISGLTITIFIGLHLFNHFCSIFGVGRHIEIMTTLRIFYRNIFIETILLTAVLAQIISGLALFRANRKIVASAFEKLHIWTGLYLATFFCNSFECSFRRTIFPAP